jgi:hypothetical protein
VLVHKLSFTTRRRKGARSPAQGCVYTPHELLTVFGTLGVPLSPYTFACVAAMSGCDCDDGIAGATHELAFAAVRHQMFVSACLADGDLALVNLVRRGCVR